GQSIPRRHRQLRNRCGRFCACCVALRRRSADRGHRSSDDLRLLRRRPHSGSSSVSGREHSASPSGAHLSADPAGRVVAWLRLALPRMPVRTRLHHGRTDVGERQYGNDVSCPRVLGSVARSLRAAAAVAAAARSEGGGNRMRILLLSHYYWPEVGAPQRRWATLVSHFISRGHQVVVAAPHPHYPHTNRDEFFGSQVGRRRARVKAKLGGTWETG